MAKYIELVLVKVDDSTNRLTILEAPAWSVSDADRVQLPSGYTGGVVSHTTAVPGDDVYNMACQIAKVEKLERLEGIIKYSPFTYDDTAPEES